ncbi:MAG: hypothetical protein IT198_14915 [Acidimicrobiia bacterium]|nr:hypothetical protein [Acidimicrobiia bacterium]
MARNITLSLPEELVRRAKILAAEQDTSVSALVASLLEQMVGDSSDYDDLWAREEGVMQSGVLRVGDMTWSRDDLHER